MYSEPTAYAQQIVSAMDKYRLYDEDSRYWLFCDDIFDEFLLSRDEKKNEDQDELIRTFKLLSSMGPGAVWEKVGENITPDCFDANQRYMSDLEISYDSKMADMRKRLKVGVNQNVFTKKEIEKNPEYAARQLNSIRVLAEIFKPGTRSYLALDEEEKLNADSLMHTFELCREAYRSAGFAEDRVNQLAVEKIKNEAKFPASIKRDMDLFFMEIQKKSRLLDKNADITLKFNYINADIFDESNFKLVADIKKAVEQNPEQYQAHKSEIDKMVKELLVSLEAITMKSNVSSCLASAGNEYLFESDPELKEYYQQLLQKLGDKGPDIFDEYVDDYIENNSNYVERAYATALQSSIMFRLTGKGKLTLDDSLKKLDKQAYSWGRENVPKESAVYYSEHPVWQGIRNVEDDMKRFRYYHPEIAETDYFSYGAYYEKELDRLKRQKPETEDDKARNEAKKKECCYKLKWARIHLGIHSRTFHYVGDPNAKVLGHPAFARSFNQELDMPVFRNMDPEAYIDNLEDIASHIFFHEPNKEELEEAKQRQKKGIREHFKYYEKHFQEMLDKYGIGPASLSMIVSNFSQIRKNTNCTQEGSNLILNDRLVLDENDENDLRLWHLTKYITYFSTYLIHLSGTPALGMSQEEINNKYKELVSDVCSDSIEYLKTHPYRER
ncbi:MAG: hypothetical protein K6E91_05955 [Butyrivibrio sp.]|nr:hypothetical protein [Butyrivibrio sp.]